MHIQEGRIPHQNAVPWLGLSLSTKIWYINRIFGLQGWLLNVSTLDYAANFQKATNSNTNTCKSDQEKCYNLTLLHINVQSINNKMLELEVLPAKLSSDVVCITGHWLHIDDVARIHLPITIFLTVSQQEMVYEAEAQPYRLNKVLLFQILRPIFSQLTSTVNFALTILKSRTMNTFEPFY